MSELLKVLICTVTAFASGELVNRVAELKWEQERRVQLDEPELPTTNNQSPQDVHRRSQTATENDQGDEPDEPKTLQKRRAGGGSLKLLQSTIDSPYRVEVTPPSPNSPSNGGGGGGGNMQPPIALSVIPATPLDPVTPLPAPDASSLHPDLPPLRVFSAKEGVRWSNVLESEYWHVLVRERTFSAGWYKVGLPACLFVVQSNLQYVAARNLSVVVFQLAYQLKIPATALFSVWLLKRTLSSQQWASLVTLSLGVGLVQLDSSRPPPSRASSSTTTTGVHDANVNQTLGLVAVLLSCCSSGFASTYFEKMLKAPPSSSSSASQTAQQHATSRSVSIWVRNIQLSLFGLALAFPLALYQMDPFLPSSNLLLNDEEERALWGHVATSPARGAFDAADFVARFLVGFDGLAWTVVVLQAVGGLLGALVMQHADNIAKCFATSMSVVLSFAVSVWVLDFDVTFLVLVGSALVLGSTWVYSTGSFARWRFPLWPLR